MRDLGSEIIVLEAMVSDITEKPTKSQEGGFEKEEKNKESEEEDELQQMVY
jgi:hypothetical protein